MGNVLLQHRLGYALNRQEARKIVKNKDGLVKIDGKKRRDPRFPLGNMDVVSLEKTNQNFRILLDVKGRFQAHPIPSDEAKYKLCKVVKKTINKKKIPHVSTHDGRTFRYPHPDISLADSSRLTSPLVRSNLLSSSPPEPLSC